MIGANTSESKSGSANPIATTSGGTICSCTGTIIHEAQYCGNNWVVIGVKSTLSYFLERPEFYPSKKQ